MKNGEEALLYKQNLQINRGMILSAQVSLNQERKGREAVEEAALNSQIALRERRNKFICGKLPHSKRTDAEGAVNR